MTEEEDNVIEFPLNYRRRNYDVLRDRGKVEGECNHLKLRVRCATRLLLCDTCGAELDQFAILTELIAARSGDEYSAHAREEDERQRAVRIEALKREEAKLRRRVREAQREQPVEAFKAATLQVICEWVDSAFARGEEIHVDRLHALDLVAWALFHDERRGIEEMMSRVPADVSLEAFRRKINAAIEEIEAREKRKRIHVVKPGR